MRRISESKEAILRAGMRLFWEQGYEAVGVEAICREAGVKKGSFYHFFSSKETLGIEVLEYFAEYSKVHFLQPSFASDLSPLERFYRYFNTMDAAIHQSHEAKGKVCGCPIGNMAIEKSNASPAVQAKITEIFEWKIALFTQHFQEAQQAGEISPIFEARALAEMLCACYQGAILLAKTQNNPGIIKTLTHQMLDSLAVRHTA